LDAEVEAFLVMQVVWEWVKVWDFLMLLLLESAWEWAPRQVFEFDNRN
jgi:hypothetical protein